jgi:putative ABC transport system permease protein
MDPRVFIYLLVIAVLAGLISGMAPALVATHVDPNHALKEAGRGTSGGRRSRRTGALLVISEFAMAVILLVGAGLVLRSVGAMLGVDTGFDPHNVLSMQIAVRGTAHEPLPLRGPFYTELVDRIGTLPGVEAVSAINHLPLHGDNWRFGFNIDGRPVARYEDLPRAMFRVIRPGYFSTMRIPLIRGRGITTEDMVHRNHVVILDETAARTSWPGADPIGQRISVNDPATPPEWFTVVGVAKDVRQPDWSEGHTGEMYYPYWYAEAAGAQHSFVSQLYPEYLTFVVRTRGNPLLLRQPITRIVQALDGDASVADVITMKQAMAEQISEPRFYLILLGAFAAAALVLAAVGVYGIVSYTVATRTREIGIRLALGADAASPFRLIVRQGLGLAITGSVIGIAGALALTRFLRSMLFEVGTGDPATFIAVPLLLVGIAVLACYPPARRAARVDPMVALRAE